MTSSASRDFKRRVAAWVGPGGITCPCCRPCKAHKGRQVFMRAAKRAERAKWKKEHLR